MQRNLLPLLIGRGIVIRFAKNLALCSCESPLWQVPSDIGCLVAVVTMEVMKQPQPQPIIAPTAINDNVHNKPDGYFRYGGWAGFIAIF